MDSDHKVENKGQSNFLAIGIGLFLCFIIIYLIEALGHILYPLPKELSPVILNDIDILKQHVANVPKLAMFFPLLSYFLGIAIGGFVANQISKRVYSGVIVGVIILLLNILTIQLIPHPFWFVIVSNMLPLPSALFGGYLSKYYDYSKKKRLKTDAIKVQN